MLTNKPSSMLKKSTLAAGGQGKVSESRGLGLVVNSSGGGGRQKEEKGFGELTGSLGKENQRRVC